MSEEPELLTNSRRPPTAVEFSGGAYSVVTKKATGGVDHRAMYEAVLRLPRCAALSHYLPPKPEETEVAEHWDNSSYSSSYNADTGDVVYDKKSASPAHAWNSEPIVQMQLLHQLS